MKLRHASLKLDEANAFVARLHRHHKPVVGHKFSIGAWLADKLVGVCIIGRPVSRMRDDGSTLEVTRLCTDGTRNACSFLYGCAARAAFALGFDRIGTYTLPEEGGKSKGCGLETDRRTRRRIVVSRGSSAHRQGAHASQNAVGGR